MIVVVDYDVGNVASLLNMFEHIGVDAEASGDPDRIAEAKKLVLPGVGAFDKAMRGLDERALVAPIRHAAIERRAPVLGVCLGMQLLGRRSEEGEMEGLGLIPADTVRITPPEGLKVPHMGWAEVTATEGARLFEERGTPNRFYFVHSYRVQCDDHRHVAAVVDYGGPICVAVEKGNVLGVQFHPEKSHRFGMQLLTRFAEIA